MATEPENLVLEHLRGIRAELSTLRDLPAQVGELRAEVNSLRADVASDFLTLNAKIDAENKTTREQIVGLRRAVVEYHSTVVGHGILISEFEARLRRVEQHLKLPPMDTH
jgi:chromosome segregation ATPase